MTESLNQSRLSLRTPAIELHDRSIQVTCYDKARSRRLRTKDKKVAGPMSMISMLLYPSDVRAYRRRTFLDYCDVWRVRSNQRFLVKPLCPKRISNCVNRFRSDRRGGFTTLEIGVRPKRVE